MAAEGCAVAGGPGSPPQPPSSRGNRPRDNGRTTARDPPHVLAPGWTSLGRSDEKSVSKMVLEALTDPRDPGGRRPPWSPLDLYRLFLRGTASFSVSHETVSLLDDNLLSRFYVTGDPSQDPKYFDALGPGGEDLVKMERCARRRVVLLTPSSASPDRWDHSVLFKVHDRRVWTTLLDGRDGAFGSSPPVALVVAKLAGPGRRVHQVYRLDEWAVAAQYNALWSERYFRRGAAQPFSGCLVTGLCRALGCPAPPEHGCPGGRFCARLGELTACPDEAHAAMGSPEPFCLVTHQGTALRTTPARARLASANSFFVLSVHGPAGWPASPLPHTAVLAVTADLDVYRLRQEFGSWAVSPPLPAALRSAAATNPSNPRRHHTSAPPPGPVGDALSEAVASTARQRRGANLELPPPRSAGGGNGGGGGGSGGGRCSCHVCVQSVKHEANMSPNGRQSLYRCEFGVFELMRLLGRLDEATERDLLRACRYATASFDVESVATRVDSDSGGGGDLPLPSDDERDGGRTRRRAYAVHEPVLVGLADWLGVEDGEASAAAPAAAAAAAAAAVKIYSGPEMTSDFLSGMTEARDRSVAVRYGILAGHFEWVERYRRRHYQFYGERGHITGEQAAAAVAADSPASRRPPSAAAAAAAYGSAAATAADDCDDNAGGADDDRVLDEVGEEVARELAAEFSATRDDVWAAPGAAAAAPADYDRDGDGEGDGDGDGDGRERYASSDGDGGRDDEDDDDDDDDDDRGGPEGFWDGHCRAGGTESPAAAGGDRDGGDGDGDGPPAPAPPPLLEWGRDVVRRCSREGGGSRQELAAAAGRLAKVRRAWTQSLLGLLETRLHALCRGFFVFGFNASSFDNIVLASRLVTLAKQRGCRSVGMQREGSSIRYLLLDGIRLCEAKRLACPGTSLDSLGRACKLEVVKGIFPFDRFTSLDFLDEPELPALASAWTSALAPHKNPTQVEVDAARAFYAASGFACVGAYLRHYLALDCLVLLRSLDAMHTRYYGILGLSFVESRKFTVSSLANAGAQTFLARHKRPGAFVCNHARLYGVSLCRCRLCLSLCVSLHLSLRLSLHLSLHLSLSLSLSQAPQDVPARRGDGSLPLLRRRGGRRLVLRRAGRAPAVLGGSGGLGSRPGAGGPPGPLGAVRPRLPRGLQQPPAGRRGGAGPQGGLLRPQQPVRLRG